MQCQAIKRGEEQCRCHAMRDHRFCSFHAHLEDRPRCRFLSSANVQCTRTAAEGSLYCCAGHEPQEPEKPQPNINQSEWAQLNKECRAMERDRDAWWESLSDDQRTAIGRKPAYHVMERWIKEQK